MPSLLHPTPNMKPYTTNTEEILKTSNTNHLNDEQNITEFKIKNFLICFKNNLNPILSLSNNIITQQNPYLFQLQIHHLLTTTTTTEQKKEKKLLFSSIFNISDVIGSPGKPFIQATMGNDTFEPGNGEYRISQNNQPFSTHQSIDSVSQLDNSTLFITGTLYSLSQKQKKNQPGEKVKQVQYEILINTEVDGELKFHLNINQSADIEEQIYDRIQISFQSSSEEQPFGLGEQFSFHTLKNQRIPIMTREQGIGRGKQPLTYILNHLPPTQPAYSGGDAYCTYTAIPHFITNQGRGFFGEGTGFMVFDFEGGNITRVEMVLPPSSTTSQSTADTTDTTTSQSGTQSIKWRMYSATSPSKLIHLYTTLVSNKQPPLPSHIHSGPIIGLQGGESEVLQKLQILKEAGIEVSGVWIQDWVGGREQWINVSFPLPFIMPGLPGSFRSGSTTSNIGSGSGNKATVYISSTSPQKRLWWNWENDLILYPNWHSSFLPSLRQIYPDLQLYAYINPFLTDIERAGKSPQSFTHNLFQIAKEKGYLVMRYNTKGELEEYLISSGPNLYAGMIDLSNPQAVLWYQSLIQKHFIDAGVKGWMADFGEYLPLDAVLYAHRHLNVPHTTKDMSWHNLYPELWAKLNYNLTKDTDHVFFMRSATAKSVGLTKLYWNGDQLPTFDLLDGLESTLYATLSMGYSGLAYTHSDIGGYTSLNMNPRIKVQIGQRVSFVKVPLLEKHARVLRNEELFRRWMEISVWGGMIYRTHEGSVPQENLQIWSNPTLLQSFKTQSQLFTLLFEYRKLLMKEYQEMGLPVMRDLVLHWPLWKMERLCYLFGPLILVVPVTVSGMERLDQKIRDIPQQPVPDDYQSTQSSGGSNKGDYSSEEEEDLLYDSNYDTSYTTTTSNTYNSSSNSRDREAKYLKARVIQTVKHFISIGFLKCISYLSRALPQPYLQEDEQYSTTTSTFGTTGTTGSFTRTGSYSAGGKKHPILRPREVPKPNHGPIYLPRGHWTHLWTNFTFYSHGMYLEQLENVIGKERYDEMVKCPIGKPGVFIRYFTKESIKTMLLERHTQANNTNNTNSNTSGSSSSTSSSYGNNGLWEDVEYWLSDRKVGESEEMAVWRKYNRFRESLSGILNKRW